MQFLDIVYNILVSPAQEFRVISLGPVPKDRLLAYAAVIVLIISGIGIIYSPAVHTTDGLALKVMLAAITGLIFWLFSGTVFSTTAYVFGLKGRPQTLLILTAFATLPWIFLPVFMMFKDNFGAFGNTIGIFGCLGLWLWTSVLYLMAIKYTYELTLERILLAASLPVLMTFLGISWIGGFFFNLFQFFAH